MPYGYKEVRTISADRLRKLCIDHDWYTGGTNEEYSHLLFDMAGDKENITTDDIVEITSDIIEHSKIDNEDFEDVAFAVANIAVVRLVRDEEGRD